MSIFDKIKGAIFGSKAEAAEPAAQTAPAPKKDAVTQSTSAAPASPAQAETTKVTPASTAPAVQPETANVTPTAAEQVDVMANLEATAKAKGSDLNWKSSIVDLMKLLGIDSSLANRKDLAKELNYTGDLDGSAEMNIWLHKAVMRELAKNGGKVPADLTD